MRFSEMSEWNKNKGVYHRTKQEMSFSVNFLWSVAVLPDAFACMHLIRIMGTIAVYLKQKT